MKTKMGVPMPTAPKRTMTRGTKASLLALAVLGLLCVAVVGGRGQRGAGAPPIAEDDLFLIAWEPEQHVLEVLGNDRDPEGAELTIVSVGPTSRGAKLDIAADGSSLHYWPVGEFEGKETFTYTIEDVDGNVATATVTVTMRFAYEVSGLKTWTLLYGLGTTGRTPYELQIEQTLTVDLRGEALSALFVEAHFNDQLPLQDQRLTVTLDTENVKGVLGDFSVSGKGDFTVYNKKLKGLRLDVLFGDEGGDERPSLTGILSQIEGISESRTFVGESAKAEVSFRTTPVDRPWETETYLRHIDGLTHFTLASPFVDGLSEASLVLVDPTGLGTLLEEYDLGYLKETVGETAPWPLPDGAAIPPEPVSEVLVFRRDPVGILRTLVRDLILAYNAASPAGSPRERYPFVEGAAVEKAFLDALEGHVRLLVDGDGPLLNERQNRRYYSLGQEDIDSATLSVEVSVGGGPFVPIGPPDRPDYRAELFASTGLVSLEFPESFHQDPERAANVSFQYARSAEVLILELSVVPGSVKVYRNGEPLDPTADYAVTYDEITTVLLFVEVSAEDVLRIDYERFRGGLGAPVEYARAFYGLSAALPLGERGEIEFSALEAADADTPLDSDAETYTMPNRHTVIGVVGTLRDEAFSSSFAVGYNQNRFPFDDNLRPSLPGSATAILATEERTYVTHLHGVSVYEDGRFTLYTAAQGLSSSRVLDVAADESAVYFASAAGLARVALDGDAPLARVTNWRRWLAGVQLPAGDVRTVTVSPTTVWVGGDALSSIRVDDLTLGGQWTVHDDAALGAAPHINDLAVAGEDLLVATNDGLLRRDADTGGYFVVDGLEGHAVTVVRAAEGGALACTSAGLARVEGARVVEWLVRGQVVHDVAQARGVLWYATDTGIRGLDGGQLLTASRIAAVGADESGTLWAASFADADYEIMVWQIDEGVTPFPRRKTGIVGTDPQQRSDLPAAEHTDSGWTGRASFARDLGPLHLTGRVESVSPQFTSIGRTDRRDTLGWGLTARLELAENGEAFWSHAFEQRDRGGQPHTVVDNELGARVRLGAVLAALWDPPAAEGLARTGPQLSLTFVEQHVDASLWSRGSEERSISLAAELSDRLFVPEDPGDPRGLALAIQWQQGLLGGTDGAAVATNTLALTADLTATRALTVSGRYRRTISGAAARESLLALTSWRPTFSSPLDIDASGSVQLDRRAGANAWGITATGDATARLTDLSLLTWSVSPRLDIAVDGTPQALVLTTTLSSPVQTGGLSIQPKLRLQWSGIGAARQERMVQADLTARHTDLATWTPTLTLSSRLQDVIYGAAQRRTVSHSVTARLSWASERGASDDLSATVRVTLADTRRPQGSVNLHNDLVGPMDALVVVDSDKAGHWLTALSLVSVIDGNVSWDEDGWGADVNASAGVDLQLNEQWGGSFTADYILTRKPYLDRLDHGLLLSLTVRVSF